MTKKEAKELLDKYADGSCTPQEKVLVERWYQLESGRSKLPNFDMLPVKSEIWESIRETNSFTGSKNKTRRIVLRLMAAASIVIIMGAGLYFFQHQKTALQLTKKQTVAVHNHDINPGGDKAILTLADGSQIVLDETDNGLIATQSGIQISKLADGTITYKVAGVKAAEGQSVTYNTIETPKGGKYHIILPDGSLVWLNAASYLRFPTAFTGSERNVELSGEAYFEVAKNKKQPFKIRANDMNISVTGTRFNVMAYKDEDYGSTTLVEGSVDVSNASQKMSLIPGQQAINSPGISLVKKEVDVSESIAWKNGLFYFNNSNIQSVMREISRWYDISVEYKGEIPQNRFGGYISRDSKLSQVIKMLELSGVKFSIEDRKLIVLP